MRAIAACPVPVISAVGHETDFTLADLAADHRAATPTAAAQMAVPDRTEMAERVAALVSRCLKAERYARETSRREWRIAAGALSDPRPLLQARRYAAAAETDALADCLHALARRLREDVSRLSAAVRDNAPSAWVSRRRGEVAVLAGKLSALDPTAVLSRGYAIAAHRHSGRVVRSVAEVAPGEPLDVRVSDGTFGAVAERHRR